MPSKYDLDKLLDPYGIESFQETITRITNPLKEYSAIAGITEQWKSQNTAFDSIKKAAASIAINKSFKFFIRHRHQHIKPSAKKIAKVHILKPDIFTLEKPDISI